MSASKRIENRRGIEFTLERGRITRARYKRGKPQKWHVIPAEQYGSFQECIAYKETEKMEVSPGTIIDSTTTFGQYWPIVLEEKGAHAPSSTRQHRYRLKSQWVAGPTGPLYRVKVRDITDEHIKLLIKRWKAAKKAKGETLWLENLKPTLSSIQMVMTHAIKNKKYRGVNPVSLIDVSDWANPKPKKRIYVLHPESEALARLFAVLDEKYVCLFALAYYTGGRISELLGLRWEHIHMDEDPPGLPEDAPTNNYVLYEGQLCAETGEWLPWLKGRTHSEDLADRSREVDLPRKALKYLREQKIRTGKYQPTDPVFPEMTQKGVQLYIAGRERGPGKRSPGIRDSLGIEFDGTGRWEEFTLHHLRHTFGSLLIQSEESLDLKYISAKMGNSIQVLEKVYAHEIEERERQPRRRSGFVMNIELPIAASR